MLSPLSTALSATLLILRLPETGAATYWQLVDHFGSALSALQQSSETLAPLLKPAAIEALTHYQQDPINSRLAQLLAADLAYIDSQPHLHCIDIAHPEYPELLRHIPKPPPLLFVRGNLECLSLPQIAIVGSRHPSAGGNENAERFAHYLAERGFAITSGLALGVDAAAHRGALSAGGKTLAVMGTGIDLIYPSRHRALAQQIIESGGALISEFPLGTASHAANFPQRNRIISGLSAGTLVVEAAVQSGSLITAAYALQHNREVFAIPGSIHNPLARGCHQLIRQGATLVETAQDILDQLDGMLSFKAQEVKAQKRKSPKNHSIDNKPAQAELILDLSPDEQNLIEAIGYDPVVLDLLVERTGIAVGDLAAQLIALEIKGAVQQTADGYQRL